MSALNLFSTLYRRTARTLSGTGVSQVYPLNRVADFVFARLKDNVAVVDGRTMHLDAGDSLGLSVYGFFEPAETELAKRLVGAGDVVVDIGANIGYFSLLFAECAGSSGKVYAFEPHPESHALLQKNIAVNGITNIVSEAKAVGAKSGRIQLYESETDNVDHATYAGDTRSRAIDVAQVSLDDYFRDQDIDIRLIKMDVQGAEPTVLAGMEKTLAKHPSIRIISEFWPYGMDRAGHCPATFLARLAEFGFMMHEIQDRGGVPECVEPAQLLERYPVEGQRFANLLCVKGA
jgi:FkbM family methyltransferase